MSKRYPTEREVGDSMQKLTAMMMHRARRFDRFRAALAELSDDEKIGMICEWLEVDEVELLEWATAVHNARAMNAKEPT